jgi:membrane protein
MTSPIRRLRTAIEDGHHFITHDIWHLGQPGEEIRGGFLIQQLRVVVLLLRNFFEDQLLTRAAALTFATMFAIVPLLAVLLFVIDTFELDKQVGDYIVQELGGMLEADTQTFDYKNEIGNLVFGAVLQDDEGLDEILERQRASLENPQGSMTLAELKDVHHQELVDHFKAQLDPEGNQPEEEVTLKAEQQAQLVEMKDKVFDMATQGSNPKSLTIIGVFFVMATLIGLMKNIEMSFNRIWGIKRSRSWYRMFSDYLIVLLFLPFLVVGAISVTAVLESDVLTDKLGIIAVPLQGVKHLGVWLTFAAVYFAVPNTRVRIRYALIGGFVAGSLWSLLTYGYIQFQIGSAKNSLIYSVFAQVPVLLMWIYSSWVILLLGAEITFAYQNEKTFALERLASGASYAYREALGLRIMLELARRFEAGTAGLAVTEAGETWNVPTRLLNDTLDELEEVGLVARCATEPVTFQPARPTDRISLGDVTSALREAGREPSELREDPMLKPVLANLTPSRDATLAELVRETVDKVEAVDFGTARDVGADS